MSFECGTGKWQWLQLVISHLKYSLFSEVKKLLYIITDQREREKHRNIGIKCLTRHALMKIQWYYWHTTFSHSFTPSMTSTPYLKILTIWKMCSFSSTDHEIKLRYLGYFPVISTLRFWCLPIGGILNLLTLKYLCLLLTSNLFISVWI